MIIEANYFILAHLKLVHEKHPESTGIPQDLLVNKAPSDKVYPPQTKPNKLVSKDAKGDDEGDGAELNDEESTKEILDNARHCDSNPESVTQGKEIPKTDTEAVVDETDPKSGPSKKRKAVTSTKKLTKHKRVETSDTITNTEKPSEAVKATISAEELSAKADNTAPVLSRPEPAILISCQVTIYHFFP